MNYIEQTFSVRYQYRVHFCEQLFNISNPTFRDFVKSNQQGDLIPKMLFVIDDGVYAHHPDLVQEIDAYFSTDCPVDIISEKLIIAGGETVKNDEQYFNAVVAAINRHGVDRHSYVAAIGGGALLDLVGYASAVSHRGIRHIRIPTTVLSQNDSGVGVKNGINYLGKKNFLGTFSPPVAVFNDYSFLTTLSDRHWTSGISEAIKVALIKDASFFSWLEENAEVLANRDREAMQYLIRHCAKLHVEHIGGADPFELGSSRPLDFGHWSAHKLEQLSDFELLHGEAVAIGIALDSMYSSLTGRLSADKCQQIISLLVRLGLPVTHHLLGEAESDAVLLGMQEFREHLGGKLTIMLLRDIGKGEEVHEIDVATLRKAASKLFNFRVAEDQL
jgi:3-dehydroquinate synthase